MASQVLPKNNSDLKAAINSAEYGSYQIGLYDEFGGTNVTVTATVGTFEYANKVKRGVRYTYRKADGTRMDWITVNVEDFLQTFSTTKLNSFESM